MMKQRATDQALPLNAWDEGIKWSCGFLGRRRICLRARRFDSGSRLLAVTFGYDGRYSYFDGYRIDNKIGISLGWWWGDLTLVVGLATPEREI
jgi:hypothetical protein